MKRSIQLSCVRCKDKPCVEGRLEKLPSFCPMKNLEDLLKSVEGRYAEPEVAALAGAAMRVALRGGYSWPRVREFIELARELKAKRIGLAFCAGLSWEAERIADLLEEWGGSKYSLYAASAAR